MTTLIYSGPCAPERSHKQRMSALQSANRIRTYRKNLKRDIAAGRVPVTRVLLDPPEDTLSMKVVELLLAVPKVGPTKAHKALRTAGVSPSKTVGGLTDRQRAELVSAFWPGSGS